MQLDQLEHLVGQLDTAGLGHSAGKRHPRLQGMRQMIGLHQLTEHFAITTNAAQTGAGDVDTMVSTGATNHPRLVRLALQAPVGTRHFYRRIGTLGPGVGKEHMIQVTRQFGSDLFSELERHRVAKLETR